MAQKGCWRSNQTRKTLSNTEVGTEEAREIGEALRAGLGIFDEVLASPFADFILKIPFLLITMKFNKAVKKLDKIFFSIIDAHRKHCKDQGDSVCGREPTVEDVPKFAFFPFGAGMSMCIGNHFAEQEAILVLASLSQKWIFYTEEDKEVLSTMLTLRPKDGMKMRLESRKK